MLTSTASQVVPADYPPRFWLLTGLAFLVSLALCISLVFLLERTRAQERRQIAADMAHLHAREIGDRLERALSMTFALGAVVRQGNGKIDQFEQLAVEMIRSSGGFGALQYAPDGVIRQIVPLAGNERALGFSPLNDPVQRLEANKAINTRALVLTGPFTLIQGGLGVVGRYPVFLDEGTSRERFWGLMQVLIRINELIDKTSLATLDASGHRYELWRYSPQNGERQVFARNSETPLGETVRAVIRVPGGEWFLDVEAGQGAPWVYLVVGECLVAILVSLLAAGAVAVLLREPIRLQHEIEVRRLTEAELQRSSERLLEIINTMDAGLVLWNREQRLLAWNKAFEKMFPGVIPALQVGATRQEVIRLMLDSGVVDREEFSSSGDWNRMGAWDRRTDDGRIIAMQRLPTSDGGRLVLYFDVTEARRAASVLARNDRMASLGKLVAGVAHEVNTPIGNSLMVASSVLHRVNEMEKGLAEGQLRRSVLESFLSMVRESDEILLRNLTRAAELVQHFKQVAVDQVSDRRRTFDLATTLEEIVNTLGLRIKHSRHQIKLDLVPDTRMDSFPGALGQIVTNLVENSLLHAFPDQRNGTMWLVTRPLDEHRVELVFRDDGIGIPGENLPHIFDPFYTTRLGQGGSGLGLSIVLNLVRDLLGGEIEVDSRVGEGCCFRLFLPYQAPPRQDGARNDES